MCCTMGSLKNILDVVLFILGQHGLVAIHGGPAHACPMGKLFSETVKTEVSRYIELFTLGTAMLSSGNFLGFNP